MLRKRSETQMTKFDEGGSGRESRTMTDDPLAGPGLRDLAMERDPCTAEGDAC
jgi:hypothetical protein